MPAWQATAGMPSARKAAASASVLWRDWQYTMPESCGRAAANSHTCRTGLALGMTWQLRFGRLSSAGMVETAFDQGAVDIVRATVPAGPNAGQFVHLKVTSP